MNADFSDTETCAKSQEALDQILSGDLSKLDSSAFIVLNVAFVKELGSVDNSSYCLSNASTLHENALQDIKAKWQTKFEKNAKFGNIETCGKSTEALHQILNGDSSKLNFSATSDDL